MRTWSSTCRSMCMHARMRRLVWSGDGTYVRRRRPWPARGKLCACAFLVVLSLLPSVLARGNPSGLNDTGCLYNIYDRHHTVYF